MSPSSDPRRRRIDPDNIPVWPEQLDDDWEPYRLRRSEDREDRERRDAYDTDPDAELDLARRRRIGPDLQEGGHGPASLPAPRGADVREDPRDPPAANPDAKPPQRKSPARSKAKLPANMMSQTEVILRLARFLDAQRLVSSDISVSLTGYEITRQNQPKFPVAEFLAERQLHQVECARAGDWRGVYQMKEHAGQNPAPCSVVLHSSENGGDLVATLRSGRRLVVFVTRGALEATRSPAEHKLFRMAIGRAMSETSTDPTDVLAVAVPRSRRFTQLANQWRSAEGVRRSGLVILLVDRAGEVHGFPADDPRFIGTPGGRRPA